MQRAQDALAEARAIITRAEETLRTVNHAAARYPEVYRAVALGEATKAVWCALADLRRLQADA